MKPQVFEAHWTEKLLGHAFSALFFAIPLLFLPFNYELFEFNKMIFVYFMTSIIGFLWLLRVVHERQLIIVRTPLDIPLLVYLAANIVTTVTSIDTHTSIFGYYSRFNGGLLSTIAYVLLYFAFTANVRTKEKVLQDIKFFVYATVLVAAYAILERLGIDKDYWVQDVQARVFSTFGQPNWLAAWLAMVIPFNLYFFFVSSTSKSKVTHFILLSVNYLAFTFTYSRGGTLGLFVGLSVFAITYFYQHRRQVAGAIQSFLPVGAGMFIVLVLFGNALLRESKFNGLLRRPVQQQVQSDTQLATPGTESSKIRLIVWQGAWDIFQHHPLFGTGVETFAYSYYQYRKAAHNQTTEWDFLYNKAHNEYLNELSTKGLVGFIPYILFIGTFLYLCLRFVLKHTTHRTYTTNKTSKKSNGSDNLLVMAILASYISYLIQNIFGFSVVGVSLLFYLLPAFYFTYYGAQTRIIAVGYAQTLLARQFIRTTVYCIAAVLFLYAITLVARFWIADTFYAKGYSAIANGNAFDAYEQLLQATYFNRSEPLYFSYLGYVASQLAELAKGENEAQLYEKFFDDAVSFTQQAIATSPRNLTIVRNATKTYTQLALLNQEYSDKALFYAQQSVLLSPTEPRDRLRYAQILHYFDKTAEAEEAFKKAIELKPDYKDARVGYAKFLAGTNQINQAQRQSAILGAIDVLQYSLEHVASPDAEIEQLIASYSSQLQ